MGRKGQKVIGYTALKKNPTNTGYIHVLMLEWCGVKYIY